MNNRGNPGRLNRIDESLNLHYLLHMKQLIENKTKVLVASLKIADQVVGLSTAETLINISIRLARLSSAAARQASRDCLNMAEMAKKYGCN